MEDNTNTRRCLADMAHATAWLNFTTAQANYDLSHYGHWRCDYAEQASMFQRDYEKAARLFVGEINDNIIECPSCGADWDIGTYAGCKCGASIAKLKE